jgi:hypothetical protein
VEQKNWAVVRTVVGYHRYDSPAELLLLNKIWMLQSQMTNYFDAQQKLVSKVRDGVKVTKKYDIATTPHRRAEQHDAVTAQDKAILADAHTGLNPAAIPRHVQALTTQLLTLTTSKAGPPGKPTTTRASTHESTKGGPFPVWWTPGRLPDRQERYDGLDTEEFHGGVQGRGGGLRPGGRPPGRRGRP